ncbi:hypothetical protein KIH41_07130 [Litoribacter ruber]|uniref:hypothetical protein n=1 Tax=Litoribacter ruber TaxID=702568 RepID=UPI001BDA2B74|nr:hypothetical protein [Litoribacter ruber]MBT0811051.1 hypothetical protein [Litoribacter ruber]
MKVFFKKAGYFIFFIAALIIWMAIKSQKTQTRKDFITNIVSKEQIKWFDNELEGLNFKTPSASMKPLHINHASQSNAFILEDATYGMHTKDIIVQLFHFKTAFEGFDTEEGLKEAVSNISDAMSASDFEIHTEESPIGLNGHIVEARFNLDGAKFVVMGFNSWINYNSSLTTFLIIRPDTDFGAEISEAIYNSIDFEKYKQFRNPFLKNLTP